MKAESYDLIVSNAANGNEILPAVIDEGSIMHQLPSGTHPVRSYTRHEINDAQYLAKS